MSYQMNKNIHAAPGSAAGFTYQFGRALWWLATERGEFEVGIETIDDISFARPDGLKLLEQDKYSIRDTGQPVTDRSVALWKTLSNWADLLSKSKKPYHFLLVTNRPVPESSLIAKLSKAKEETEALRVIEDLLGIAKKPSETIKPFCDIISNCAPNVLQRLICLTELLSSDSAETDWESMLNEAAEGLRLPSSLLSQALDILNELLGWVVDVSMRAWKSGRPATITSQSFANAVDRVKERSRRQHKRERPPSQVPVTPDEFSGIVKNLFVEQLNLVDRGEETVEAAINDFIRYGKEVIRLTKTGEYTPKDWEEFEAELQTRWKRIFERIQRMHVDEEEEFRGARAYHETTTDFLARLKGEPTDHVYFTAGAYHRLADELDVGWHPRFLELLTKEGGR